ncbi:dTDP-glucose 4,6-dehydratase [Candidatus Termititenax persephonae]|uniref:dTDP-glucose 4,6-dehydratase n=1 Tax=Candidatus Termititenax persephonae TaxID=2218525 RepID=A0A388TF26_9BACT|nr:dTDP-glucose 4,6-dehydratase [Candidatus Termititenax persephonae]
MLKLQSMKKILITGGAGFIGSCFVRQTLQKHPDYQVINLDALTYAGNLETLADIEQNPRYRFVQGDIGDKNLVDKLFAEGLDYVINFAAESHVDRSISGPEIFVRTNVLGTQNLLEAVRKYWLPSAAPASLAERKYLQVSTDEVYGSLGQDGYFTEETPLQPNSPYSASKAGADLLVRAYFHTFGLPLLTTRCSNNYGPCQFPEKLLPLMISQALANQPLPVYGDGRNVRDWLHVSDHCAALDLVLHQGTPGEVYNIGGHNEKENIYLVRLVLRELQKPETLIHFVQDRPGHDRRYAIDATKMSRCFGWQPRYTFEQGIQETIQWYIQNQSWVDSVKSGAYQKYSAKGKENYGKL